LANVVLSQNDDHAPFGGVVPEIAARAHVAHLDGVVAQAMEKAGIGFAQLDAIAATAGPGLIGGVIVGLTTAKAIALVHGCALIAVNHLEGHALTVRLVGKLEFPYLLLLVSGGHTQILAVEGVGKYQRLGTTLDDALGEAFDKTAKLLGLEFPGGPQVERRARQGDPARFALPRPLVGEPHAHFSFSGLKTAVRRAAQSCQPLSKTDVDDLCASFQAAATAATADRVAKGIALYRDALREGAAPRLVVAGGVAANKALVAALGAVASQAGFSLHVPPPALCTDNGAMIAWAGLEHLRGRASDSLDTPARARWPLDANAPVAIGAGVKA
ncbi:MAG: tRNA (adenosine(37)-N6)-threonylcarbamoyltransferase complex transferase subunit TsaD, partial [Alphaproteobacteria bacterium]